MPKISVIMPSLNVADYIRPCMESVLAQTLSDIEILVVDAGSTDGTLAILAEFAQNDSRITILFSDRKSYGYQLNMGIRKARGEYVGVVETDDIIEADMLRLLYEKAIMTGADYVKGAAELFTDISSEIRYSMPARPVFSDLQSYDTVLSPRELPELFVKDVYLWDGIYRNGFIKQIVLHESAGAAYQDAGFMFQAYTKAERAVYLANTVYRYRQDNTRASSYDKRAFGYFVGEYDYMEPFLKDMSGQWQEAYYIRMLDHCRRRFQVMGTAGAFWEEARPDMEELRRRLQMAADRGILQDTVLEEEQCIKLHLFLQGPEVIYESYRNDYVKAAGHIQEMMRLAEKKGAVIFGCGRIGRFLHALIENKKPGTVMCFCDNEEKLRGKKIQGAEVLAPAEAVCRFPDALYLIGGTLYEVQIREQLRELGVDSKRQFTYMAGRDMLLFQL